MYFVRAAPFIFGLQEMRHFAPGIVRDRSFIRLVWRAKVAASTVFDRARLPHETNGQHCLIHVEVMASHDDRN